MWDKTWIMILKQFFSVSTERRAFSLYFKIAKKVKITLVNVFSKNRYGIFPMKFVKYSIYSFSSGFPVVILLFFRSETWWQNAHSKLMLTVFFFFGRWEFLHETGALRNKILQSLLNPFFYLFISSYFSTHMGFRKAAPWDVRGKA